MNYGMAISASAALTAMHRLDVAASNLANASTVAFKPDISTTRQRDPARIEDGLLHMPSNRLLEQLGAGVLLAPSRINFAQGPINTTSQPLDLAIKGDGFLVVRAEQSQQGSGLRLSRDGRLSLDPNARLVRRVDGLPLLDTGGNEIHLRGSGPVQFGSDGTIRQDGQVVAQLQFIDVSDRTMLRKEGEGLFVLSNNTVSNLQRASGQIIQHALEGAAVNEISAMMQLTAAAKSAQGALGMIRNHDLMMDRAINGLGRIG